MNNKNKKLVFRIKKVLEEKGLTISEFAEKAGLHYNTALSIVNGKYKRIGLDTLTQMCHALNCDIQDIFTWE